jgi:thioredoxin 1
MAVEATPETFSDLVAEGNVLVDFWGPRCQPCLALMPAVEALEQAYDGRLRLVKVNAPDNRQVCRDLKVFGLPTYVLYRDGAEVERLTGDPSRADIEAAVKKLVDGRSEGGE